jgi:hypothetical protein
MKKIVVSIIAFLFCALQSNAQISNAPSFTTNPNSLTTCEFTTATFDVVALDYDSLRWQVFSNSTWSDLADTGSVSGSATSTLVISNLILAYNASQIRCVAYGQIVPNAISSTAILTVLKVPAITSFTPSRTICENDNCSFNVQSPGGNGLFTYQWQVDSGFGFVDVINNFNYTGATTKTINIASCPANMNMFYYRCIVSGPCNASDTSTAVFLKVNLFPAITVQPSSKTICSGSNSNLTITATGTSLSYQWQQEVNGVFTNIVSNGIFSAPGTNTLNIYNIPDSLNNTRYICRISSVCGTPVYSDTITITVINAPIAPVFSNYNLTPCADILIDYSINAIPNADTYTWNSSSPDVTVFGADTVGILISSNSATSADISVYASNQCGNSDTTFLSINSSPSYSIVNSFSTCANDSILLDGLYYYADTSITTNYTTTNGCDSTIINTLLFNPSYNIQSNLSLCAGDSIFINGAWQFTDGTFTESYTTTNGCDSTINTTLTFNLGYYAYMQESICFGDSLLYDGVYYSTAGVYPFNYTSSTGCDSIVELNLSVNSLPIVSFALDTTLCENGSLLDLTNYVSPIGGTWTGFGVVGNNFNPASTGAGSFEINYTYADLNGCIGSSVDSITVDVCSGLYDNEIPNLALYPNPTSDILHLNGLQNQSLIAIYDVTGKMVLQVEVDKNSNNSINTTSLAPGFYRCRIQQNNQTAELSFIKK